MEVKLKQRENGAEILLSGNAVAPGQTVSLGDFGTDGDALEPRPRSAVFYVNPANDAAYQTIQSAINAAVAVTGEWPDYDAVIEIANATWVEDLQIDLTDDRTITLRGVEALYGVYLSGTIEYNSVANSVLILENIYSDSTISGELTGPGQSAFRMVGCGIDGAISFTGAVSVHSDGGGGWNDARQGYHSGISTAGPIALHDTQHGGNVVTTGVFPIVLSGAGIALGRTFTTAGTEIYVFGGVIGQNSGFVFSGDPGRVIADSYAIGAMAEGGAVPLTNAILDCWNGSQVDDNNAATDNVAAFDLWTNAPAGMYRVDVYLAIATAGTAGAIVPKVTFTDEIGAVTASISTGVTDISAAAPQRHAASYTFYHVGGGTADIQASITGVVTPGTLAYRHSFALTFLGNG